MKARTKLRIPACILIAALACAGVWAEDAVYLVQKGDTLFGIAKANGLVLQELLDANRLSAKAAIKVGQKLILPGKGSPKDSEKPLPDKKVETLVNYQVKKGDTLYGIARQTGLDLKTLLKLNNLGEKANITVGQILKVPAGAPLVASATAKPTATVPAKTPAASASPDPVTSPVTDPNASQSVDMAENTAQATEGTLLKTKPYTAGAKLSWPHPGERLLVDGKLPGLLIRAAKGDLVKSIADGKVVYSGPHSTLGHIVFVQSASGFIYIYGGNEGSALKVGVAVNSGDALGLVGLTRGCVEPEIYCGRWKEGA